MSVAVEMMMKGRRRSGAVRGVLVLILVLGLALVGQGLLIPAKAALAQVLMDRAFSRAQETDSPVKAWPWADTAPIARITAPRLGVSEIVLSGGSGEAMAFGPTHMPGSALPGQRGTAVFAAHRDTHFRFLKDLRPGDVLGLEDIHGVRTTYRVEGGYVVRNDRFGIDRHAVKLALTTCWPFDADRRGPMRYVLMAQRVPDQG
ncbi:MAG: class GN sortase [Brevundimonas sp.]